MLQTRTSTTAFQSSRCVLHASYPCRATNEPTELITQGETSALLNLARILGGFSVTYFQVPWASRNGALQTFGCEAAVVAGLFLLIVPALQVKGQYFRVRFSILQGHCGGMKLMVGLQHRYSLHL